MYNISLNLAYIILLHLTYCLLKYVFIISYHTANEAKFSCVKYYH